MNKEKKLKLSLFCIITALHLLVIFFFVVQVNGALDNGFENAKVMKLANFEEEIPPALPLEPLPPPVEEIAETIVVTETNPDTNIVAAGTLVTTETSNASFNDYLPMHKISNPPVLDEKLLTQAIVYPPIALRSGIEGTVYLELFIDYTGKVRRIVVLKENPPDRGFAEAAIKVFEGFKCKPAFANGKPVSCHIRYPLKFAIK